MFFRWELPDESGKIYTLFVFKVYSFSEPRKHKQVHMVIFRYISLHVSATMFKDAIENIKNWCPEHYLYVYWMQIYSEIWFNYMAWVGVLVCIIETTL